MKVNSNPRKDPTNVTMCVLVARQGFSTAAIHFSLQFFQGSCLIGYLQQCVWLYFFNSGCARRQGFSATSLCSSLTIKLWLFPDSTWKTCYWLWTFNYHIHPVILLFQITAYCFIFVAPPQLHHFILWLLSYILLNFLSQDSCLTFLKTKFLTFLQPRLRTFCQSVWELSVCNMSFTFWLW